MPVILTAALTVLFAFVFVFPAYAHLKPPLVLPSIVINLPSRTLELYSGDNLLMVYPVAIGKASSPTPCGDFQILDKVINPTWYPPNNERPVPSGPFNPLGYRWMGIYSSYGLHGTNDPWSIGKAVSHGCIRMNEGDVEELFELVPSGTRVRVTYDRVKAYVDSTGVVSIGFYPDVYGYKNLTLTEVKQCLADKGFSGFIADDELIRLMTSTVDRRIEIARLHNIKLNGKLQDDRAVTINNISYLPAAPLAKATGKNFSWDETGQMVRSENQAVPGMTKGGKVYITAGDAERFFGGQIVWQKADNSLEIRVYKVLLNGKEICGDVRMINDVPALPLLRLAEVFGQKISQGGQDQAFWLQGKQVAVVYIDNIPYISITKIYDLFQVYVRWDQSTLSIELTDPFLVSGGTD